jgi:hypothetical protein
MAPPETCRPQRTPSPGATPSNLAPFLGSHAALETAVYWAQAGCVRGTQQGDKGATWRAALSLGGRFHLLIQNNSSL